jgi:hypothetical protein
MSPPIPAFQVGSHVPFVGEMLTLLCNVQMLLFLRFADCCGGHLPFAGRSVV